MNIYVGNLSYSATEDQLRDLFAEFGQVESVSVITDRATGRPRGFAFVEMPDDAEGQKAIDEINGKELDDRALKINMARPRSEGGNRGGSGGRNY